MKKSFILLILGAYLCSLFICCSTSKTVEKDNTISDRNKAFITEYIEAFSGKKKTEELMNKYIDESCVDLRQHIMENEARMPNFEIDIEKIDAKDDIVVVHGNVMGFRTTDMKFVSGSVILNYQIHNGKIIKFWTGK